MYKHKKPVERRSLLLSFINFLFWICLLGLSLSLLLFQQPTSQLEHEIKKMEVKQDA